VHARNDLADARLDTGFVAEVGNILTGFSDDDTGFLGRDYGTKGEKRSSIVLLSADTFVLAIVVVFLVDLEILERLLKLFTTSGIRLVRFGDIIRHGYRIVRTTGVGRRRRGVVRDNYKEERFGGGSLRWGDKQSRGELSGGRKDVPEERKSEAGRDEEGGGRGGGSRRQVGSRRREKGVREREVAGMERGWRSGMGRRMRLLGEWRSMDWTMEVCKWRADLKWRGQTKACTLSP
jgi:hypothetical protein